MKQAMFNSQEISCNFAVADESKIDTVFCALKMHLGEAKRERRACQGKACILQTILAVALGSGGYVQRGRSSNCIMCHDPVDVEHSTICSSCGGR